MARIEDPDVRLRALQRSAIDSRLRALTSRGLTFTKQGDSGDVYIVQSAALFHPSIGHWRMIDGSASGYALADMIRAIDDAQLRSMIPIGKAAVVSPLGSPAEPTAPAVPRDSVSEHGGDGSGPDSSALSPLATTDLTQPRSAEGAAGASALQPNRWP